MQIKCCWKILFVGKNLQNYLIFCKNVTSNLIFCRVISEIDTKSYAYISLANYLLGKRTLQLEVLNLNSRSIVFIEDYNFMF